MSIVRRAVRPEARFYTLDKSISEDKRLSWAARGMLVFLLGKPDHWQVSVAHLTKETAGALGRSSGRDAVYGLLTELIDAGYIDRTQGRAEAGQMGGIEYVVQEVPAVRVLPLPEKPDTAHPDTAGPVPANPTLASTDLKGTLKGQQGDGASAKPAAVFPELPAFVDAEAWKRWVDMRDLKKSPLTPLAMELALKALTGFVARGATTTAVLDQSTLSKWTGLFMVKGQAAVGAGESTATRRARLRHAEMSGGLVAAKDPALMPTRLPVGPEAPISPAINLESLNG